MATFTVHSGLNLDRRVPDSQVLIIGRKSALKEAELDGKLGEKLSSAVSADLFGKAKASLTGQGAGGNGSVSLHLDLATIAVVPDANLSRYNTPSNAQAIFKQVKAVKMAKGVKHLSVVLYTSYGCMMASVTAVARAFPLFSAKTKPETGLESVSVELVLTPPTAKPLADTEVAFLQSLCENVRTCARLVDTPANILHTEKFLEEAIAMVDATGMPVGKNIVKGKELQERGFGGIYSVGQAAKHPPIFACFMHMPEGAKETVALVGKGIVYDTGGLSLKGKLQMPSMKIDMGGAAAVLAAFCTLVKAGFSQNLHCLLCIAENQISPEATRPDDIIHMLSGKSVEVNNTDAEGRLVLADGVFYAKETLRATTIIDMATLTGLQVSATGKYHAAILCSSDKLEAECVRAGKKSGEMAHPLPFCPELHFAENLGSKVADMKNARLDGGSTGPPTAIAGLFIGSHIGFGGKSGGNGAGDGAEDKQEEEGTGGNSVDWLHIDMAGLTLSEGRATGYGVALLSSLLAKHTEIGVAKMDSD